MTSRSSLWLMIPCIVLACTKEAAKSPGSGTNSGTEGSRLGISFGSITLPNYCDARARLECYRLQACYPTNLQSLYGNASNCFDRSVRRCEGAYLEEISTFLVNEGTISYFPVQMARAFEIHSRRHCNSSRVTPSPFVAVEANLTIGSPCKRSEFCRTGYCTRANSNECGVCAEPPAPLPSDCPKLCASGEFCNCVTNDGGRSCACKRALRPYEDCSGDRNACDEGSRCIDGRSESGDRVSACVPFPNSGETCGVKIGFLDCVGELYCENENCTRPALASRGSECNTRDRICPQGHDCRGSCVEKAANNQSCISRNSNNIPDGGPPTCAEGLCNRTCRGLSSQGEFCIDASDCEPSLGCYASRNGSRTCVDTTSLYNDLETLFLCP